MTERTQRRAAEHKARKAEAKRLRNQAQHLALKAGLNTSVSSSAEAAQPQLSTLISEAQLTANRANSLLSTGPATDLGKSISARNNFRHGLTQNEGDPILLESESQTDYAQLLAGYQKEWQPATPTECDLVNRLVTHSWLRRRALGLQRLFVRHDDGLIIDQKQFNLYQRYETQHERAFNKALSDLLRLRSLRLREQNGFESQRRKDEKHQYQIRHLQHRERLHQLAELTAEARLTVAQGKQTKAQSVPNSNSDGPLADLTMAE